MMTFKKSLAILAFLNAVISFNALASDNSTIAALETTPPSAEGALTADQTQAISMPKTAEKPGTNAATNQKSAA